MEQAVYDEILGVASLAGVLTLESGGEIYRVEEIMSTISRTFGAAHCESYATPTTIMLTIFGEDEKPYTVMKRIHAGTIALSRVDAVNRVSRRVAGGGLTLGEAKAALLAIQRQKGTPLWAKVLASSAACAAFVLILGGGLGDAACGLLSGALLRLCVEGISRLGVGFFFLNLSGGAAAAALGGLFQLLGMAQAGNRLTVATMMLLVPGLLFTNAFRDIVAGDLVSGISRVFETLAVAVALACGAAMTYGALTLLTGVAL